MHTKNRNGFTAIELAVSIIIILVLCALLLPAVQRTREASPRSDCKNRLKQLGIALDNYHEVHGTFPPGWVSVRGPSSGDQEQSAYGWATYVLPFFDQAPLYKKIRFDADDPSFQAESQYAPVAFAATELTWLRCPSSFGDPVDRVSSVPAIATTNYVANFGVGVPTLYHDYTGNQGIFGCNSRVRIRDIRDGTTNCVLLGERMLPDAGHAWPLERIDGPFNSYWAGIPRGTNPLAIVATVTDGDITDVLADGQLNWPGKLNGFNQVPRKVRGILVNKTASGRDLSAVGTIRKETSAGFSSYHPLGVQVLLADDSVRFVSNSVDPNTWINLMRRNDGMTLGEF